MKTKNIRKKALLSSVAMLLVAVVALGGATYAWFSANTTATAGTFSLAAQPTSNLRLAPTTTSAEADWTSTYSFGQNQSAVVNPCSTDDGKNFVKVTAAGNQSVIGGSTVVNGIVAASSTDIYSKSFAVKSGADAALTIHDITGATNLGAAMRMSITVTDPTNTSITATKIYAPSDSSWYGVKHEASFSGTGVTYDDFYNGQNGASSFVTQLTATALDAGIINLSAGKAYDVTVRFWLEGNDSHCVDGISSLSDATIGITFGTTTTMS